jgi:hypothetical protein
MAYTENKAYNPYDFDRDAHQAMSVALKKKDYARVLEQAKKILEKNYLDVNAHLATRDAYTQMEKPEQAMFHGYVADGLVKSIMTSGDGKSPQTAFKVISTDEEYVILDALGLEPKAQALIKEKDHSYDRLEGVDRKTNKMVTLYFNIDIPLSWLKKSFKK